MGEWHEVDAAVQLRDVLSSPAFGIPSAVRARLAVALVETGMLVTTRYYVPDASELFEMYRQLAEVEHHAGKRTQRTWMRWVMCVETHIALHRRYSDRRSIHTPELSAFLSSDGQAPLTDTVMDQVFMVVTSRAAASIPAALDAGRLFDMPIRRDPAARRPMFELIPEEERR